jgi:hypothetical protein
VTDETSEQRMARLRAESTMSPEEQREHTDMIEAATAAARDKLGPIEDRRISRTKWAEPNHFRVVRPAPDTRPSPDEEVEP